MAESRVTRAWLRATSTHAQELHTARSPVFEHALEKTRGTQLYMRLYVRMLFQDALYCLHPIAASISDVANTITGSW